MLSTIREFFEKRLASGAEDDDARQRLQIATAALLVEVMRVDGIEASEREMVLGSLRSKFGLSDADARALVEFGEAEARESVGYYQFTSLINRHFSIEQKERIVGLMWQVAYADATLSAHELHVIRKIADLLHVPYASYIGAKLRARDASG